MLPRLKPHKLGRGYWQAELIGNAELSSLDLELRIMGQWSLLPDGLHLLDFMRWKCLILVL